MYSKLLILSLATSVIAVTLSKTKVFKPMRHWIWQRNTWSYNLISCTYCLTHWVAFTLVSIYPLNLMGKYQVIDYFVSSFAVVAIAAVIGGIIKYLNPNPPDDFTLPSNARRGRDD